MPKYRLLFDCLELDNDSQESRKKPIGNGRFYHADSLDSTRCIAVLTEKIFA